MDIERASAKVRADGVADDEEDYSLPIYAERIPVRTVLGAHEPCRRLLPNVERPQELSASSGLRPRLPTGWSGFWSAFVQVTRRAAQDKISHRTAAMSTGVEKVRAGKQLRGLFP